MDTLRLMLLTLLIGASVSTSPTYTQDGFGVNQTIVMPQQQVAVQATVQPVATAQPTPRPTARPSATQRPIDTGTFITRNLYKGCTGDDVRYLQQWLANLGYGVVVDGSFGESTRQAVLRFQMNNGLTADGVAGAKTIRRLVSADAVPEGNPFTRTLSYGMTGEDVRALQTRLKALGYYEGAPSGYFGDETRAALQWFQRINGLADDGIAGYQTHLRLYSSAALPATTVSYNTLSYGSRGEAVRSMQARLCALNYLTASSVDGTFGTATRNAVFAFQQMHNLPKTGVADSMTLSLLYSSHARPYASATATPAPSPTAVPTQAPTPTATAPIVTAAPTEAPKTCEHCQQAIKPEDGDKHTVLAACSKHYQCEEGNHSVAACGFNVHFACDGKTHEKLTCGSHCAATADKTLDHNTKLACGHYACKTNLNHSAAPCGEAGHYQCANDYQAATHTTKCVHCKKPQCVWETGTQCTDGNEHTEPTI